MIRCLDEIGEQIRRALGLSMTATQMESVLRGDAVHINEDARKIIDRQADAYVHRLLSAITESGLDTRAMPAVFLGGGAALFLRGGAPLGRGRGVLVGHSPIALHRVAFCIGVARAAARLPVLRGRHSGCPLSWQHSKSVLIIAQTFYK